MSDPDDRTDPLDEAYRRAEARLDDEAARAARRARVLSAVARETAASEPADASAHRRPILRRGGWLVAASIAGLGLVVTAALYPLATRPPVTTPAATAEAPAAAQAPAPAQPALAAQSTATTATTPEATSTPQAAAKRAAPPPAAGAPIEAPSPPPPPAAPREPRPFPAAAAPPPIASAQKPAFASSSDVPASAGAARDEATGLQETIITAGRRAENLDAAAAPVEARHDAAARLRAAAAAGQTGEIATLLEQGAPVDAPDAAGDTALMKSIEADKPAAAALLRRHGASLDHRNKAGRSARDLTTDKADPELDQALGLRP